MSARPSLQPRKARNARCRQGSSLAFLFCAVPVPTLDARQQVAWFYDGDGMKLELMRRSLQADGTDRGRATRNGFLVTAPRLQRFEAASTPRLNEILQLGMSSRPAG
jgi:hypothetical protein